MVAVGGSEVDSRGVIVEQVADESRDVVDLHLSIAVHVTCLDVGEGGEGDGLRPGTYCIITEGLHLDLVESLGYQVSDGAVGCAEVGDISPFG